MTRKSFAILIIALVANFQVFATVRGTQKKIHKVYTNDTSGVEGMEVKFYAELSLGKSTDKILIETSNPKIATVSSAEAAIGEVVTATLHGMGTAVISMISKENPRQRKSFQIMVLDSRKQNSNSLVTGQIALKRHYQVLLHAAKPEAALMRFGVENLVYESQAAYLMWDLIPDPSTMKAYPELTKEEVAELAPKGTDSCHVFVRLPGKHKLLLVASDGERKDTIASARIDAQGEALLSFIYTLRNESIVRDLNSFKITGPDAIDGSSDPAVNTFVARHFASVRKLKPKFEITSNNKTKVVIAEEDLRAGTKKLLFTENGSYTLKYSIEQHGTRTELDSKTVLVSNTAYSISGPTGNVTQSILSYDIDFNSQRGGVEYTLSSYHDLKNAGADPILELGNGEGKIAQTKLVDASTSKGRFFFYTPGVKNLKYSITVNGTKKTIASASVNITTVTIPEHIKISSAGVEAPGVSEIMRPTDWIPMNGVPVTWVFFPNSNPNRYGFQSQSKYYQFDNYDNKYHQVVNYNKPEWKNPGTFVDNRPQHSSITAAMKTYKIKRTGDGKLWMAEGIRYVPPAANLASGVTVELTPKSTNQDRAENYKRYIVNTATEQVFYSRKFVHQGVPAETIGDITAVGGGIAVPLKKQGPCPNGWHIVGVRDLINRASRNGAPGLTDVAIKYHGFQDLLFYRGSKEESYFSNMTAWKFLEDDYKPAPNKLPTGFKGTYAMGDQSFLIAERYHTSLTVDATNSLYLEIRSDGADFSYDHSPIHSELEVICVSDN